MRFSSLLPFCGFLFLLQPVLSQSPAALPARNGIIDLRGSDLLNQTISLNGQWNIYWRKLLLPGDTNTIKPGTANFPGLWNNTVVEGNGLTAKGFATYTLTVLLPAHSRPLAMAVPDFYTSYRLFVNGREFANNGVPGRTAAETVPKWMDKTLEIPGNADTLHLLLQVANFLHSKGGPYKSILLGDKDRLLHEREVDEAFDLVLTGCWFMGGLFFLGLYFFGRHDKSILYFSLFALTYSYRIIGTRLYVLHSIFPHLPWSLTLHFEYLSFFSSIAFFTLYTRNLYPEDSNKYIINTLVWLCVGFSVVVLVFPPDIFTRLINPFLVVMTIMIGYGFYIYMLAMRNRRVGAIFAMLSTCVVLLVFVVVILQYFQLINTAKGFLFAGYTSFFFLQSLILSFRYTYALKKTIAQVEQKVVELRAAQAQLIQSEKMASLGELTAGIAHEIQNPLNFVNNFSEINQELIGELKEEIKNGNNAEVNAIVGDIESNEQKINHHGKRADAIVKGMLQHSRSGKGQKEPADLNVLCEEYLRLSYHGVRAKNKEFNATINTDFDKTIEKINIIPQDIGRVLLNVYNNAFWAAAEKKNPEVMVSTKKQNNKILISVKDNGNGIAQQNMDKIFQPFFTTKPTGQGTGLGLSLSYDIIKAHGGEIKIGSTGDTGTDFRIEIPLN